MNMRNIIELPQQQQLMLLVILLHLLCFSCTSIAASDMISKGQHISDGQTIVSAIGVFELGFFSPGNSTNRYVGIWYKNVSVQTIVWVANRERPVTDSTGILMINNDGALVIMDLKGNSILIGHGSGSGGTNICARLLDDGNLILGEGDLDKNRRVLWQSFDYPTDTFLPGMKLGRNLKSKVNRLFTSWRSLEDPSPGTYSLGMDPNGRSQFFIWNKGVVHWSSGEWNGEIFSLVPEMRLNYLYKFSYVTNENEHYITYSLYNSSILSRLVLDISGQIKQNTWLESSGAWRLLWLQPRDICDVFSKCGVYASCNSIDNPPCKCLPGFEPVSPKDWELNNWSGGCVRSTKLKCGNQDRFLQLRRMKLPDQMQYVTGMGQDAIHCEAMCMKNCSCIAYSPDKVGCLLWDKDLIGIQENYLEQDLFIRVAAPEFSKHKPSKGKDKARLWEFVVVAVVLALLLSGFFLLYLWRRKLKRRGDEKEEGNSILKELETNITATKFNNINTDEGDTKDSNLQLFSFASILAATDNFSAANKLGEGGFGPVYKGKLLDGREVAVKRLSISSRQGLEEFNNEILLVAKLQHTNLVQLFGCCIQGEEKMLIYEYMPNNSLDSFLLDPTKRTILDWGKRVNIIDGIAQGILYLHRYSRLTVVHRDLKASNILLDGDMNPKISDFGMARVFGKDKSETNTNKVVGTYGYMSPEYAMEGIFSTKSDVFSFGVLLLEILSGKKSTRFNHSECSLNLLGYAWQLWKDNKGMELIDPTLVDSVSDQDFLTYMIVGLLCVQENPIDRPTMQEVMSMLIGGVGSVLPAPKQTAFFVSRSATETKSFPGTGSGPVK